MKVLIVATCLLAAASAGFIGHHGYAGHVAAVAPLAYAGHYGGHYTGPQHIPVIGADGIPVDTPAVAAARAGHAVAVATTAARNAHVNGATYSAGLTHAGVIGAHGVPVDTPAVAAARASHAAAHAATAARDATFAHATLAPVAYATHGLAAPLAYATHGLAAPVAHYTGPQHLPVIGPNGVPLDTPEVAAGKAANAHFHAEAHARNGDHYAGLYGYAHGAAAHGIVAPVAHGVVVDTPAVAHARAAHIAAHAAVAATHGHLSHGFVAHHY